MGIVTNGVVHLADLNPHPMNYNRHSERQVIKLSQAIQADGFTNPIIVNSANTILGGHARHAALQRLFESGAAEPGGIHEGWQVPVRVVDCDEAAQLRILATDNPRRDDVDIDEMALLEILQSLSDQDALAGTWWETEDVEILAWEDCAISGNQAGSESRKAANERMSKAIKVVIASEDVGVIHRALTARGGKLGQALTSICREYLETVGL